MSPWRRLDESAEGTDERKGVRTRNRRESRRDGIPYGGSHNAESGELHIVLCRSRNGVRFEDVMEGGRQPGVGTPLLP